MIKRCFLFYVLAILGALFPVLMAAEKNDFPRILEKSARQLNVIYFLGSDMKPVPDYERRLSELLLHLQDFYGKEMLRNGYGFRSFGLGMKSPGRVKIFVYKAQNTGDHYSYENGGDRILDEMEEFYEDHPKFRKSAHKLFILPAWNGTMNKRQDPWDVPFYGMGRDCFVLDYSEFDIKHLGKDTEAGRLLTKWYGGLAHELGHGLNLPHNHATVSLEQKYGTALMGEGNYTFSSSPTFLTPASCAILDVCEVVSSESKKAFYQKEPAVRVEGLSAFLSAGKEILSLSGKYASDRSVRALNVYVLDPPYEEADERDYDSFSFSFPMGKKDGHFSVEIDRKELAGLKGEDYLIELMFVLEDGQLFHKKVEFKKGVLLDYREKDGKCTE